MLDITILINNINRIHSHHFTSVNDIEDFEKMFIRVIQNIHEKTKY